MADQAVGVFVAAALPWAVGVCEVDFDAGIAGEVAVSGHFGTAIIGEGFAQAVGHLVEQVFEGALCGGCVAGVHLGDHDEAAGALDQGADGGFVSGSLDEITFPVPWNQAFCDFFGPGCDLDVVGDEAAAVFAA